MIIKDKNILSDGSLGGQHQTRQIVTRRNLMNIANSKSALLNNSFTSVTQEKICNCLGCYEYADDKISLTVGAKSITIFVCENCKPKFEN